MKKIPTLFERVYDNHKIVDILPYYIEGIAAIVPDVKTPKGKTTMIEFCDL